MSYVCNFCDYSTSRKHDLKNMYVYAEKNINISQDYIVIIKIVIYI